MGLLSSISANVKQAQPQSSQQPECITILDDLTTGPEITERATEHSCQCGSRFTWTDSAGVTHCIWCASQGRSEACLYAWLDTNGNWHCGGCDPAPAQGHPLRLAVERWVKAIVPSGIVGDDFTWVDHWPRFL